MKYLFLFLSIFLIASNAIAQYVGLSDKEVSILKDLIKKDNDVKNLYSSLKKIADEALGQKPDPIDTVVSEGHLATDPKKNSNGKIIERYQQDQCTCHRLQG